MSSGEKPQSRVTELYKASNFNFSKLLYLRKVYNFPIQHGPILQIMAYLALVPYKNDTKKPVTRMSILVSLRVSLATCQISSYVYVDVIPLISTDVL